MEPCRDFEEWRNQARGLLADKVHFDEVSWATGFFFAEPFQSKNKNSDLRIPKEFLARAVKASAFRDDSTWALLYRVAFRLCYEDRNLLNDPLDADVRELERREHLVSRDMHKMKAFVRFREVEIEGEKHYFSWHRPDHKIIHLIAPFFRDRFNGMKWTIMTEDGCAHWNKSELTFSEGVLRSALPDDNAEDLWKTYYTSVFNPGRVKEGAMKKEMPVRYWQTLPESTLITELMREAPERLEAFYESQRVNTQKEFSSLTEMNEQLLKCRACGICPAATAPVRGEGPENAKIMIVGEQPGDEEDKIGKPFQGPSGDLFDEMLRKSGFRREDLYVTNAVKGFKHIVTGSFRKHRTALQPEISSCKPWLKEEIRLVKPELIVCLGRTAAQSVIGKMVKMEDVRGKLMTSAGDKKLVVLPHPASILRSAEEEQERLKQGYLEDFIRLKGL